MTKRLTPHELAERAETSFTMVDPCVLCPRRCKARRLHGELGYCGAGDLPKVARMLPHFGEEPPLVGNTGAGAIFFSHCNMRCVFCQNYQISQGGLGSYVDVGKLADGIMNLAAQGCVNIEPVSPTHYLPWFLEALAESRRRGLDLPVVYNSNGYESSGTLELLDGVVDIYMPDLKYASNITAKRFSDSADYASVAGSAVIKMYGSVGDLVVNAEGVAIGGLIIRLLILPENTGGIFESLTMLKKTLGCNVTISLMSQYSPLYKAHGFAPLDRRVIQAEYDSVIDFAWDMGFEDVFIQDFSSQDSAVPDFSLAAPFKWD